MAWSWRSCSFRGEAVTATHRRKPGTSSSCDSGSSAAPQLHSVILPIAALGCLLATLFAQAGLGKAPSAPASDPWGHSLDHVRRIEKSNSAGYVNGVRLRVEPNDCLIIGSTDRRSLNHSISVDWQPVGSDQQQTPPSTSPDVVVRSAVRRMIAARGREQSPKVTVEKAEPAIVPANNGEPVTRAFRVPFLVPALSPQHSGSMHMSDRACLMTCLVECDRVRVYSEDPPFSGATAQTIASTIANSIRPQVERRLGSVRDVDHDGYLTIALIRLTSSDTRESHPLLGCVRPADFLGNDPTSGDIVYIDPRIVSSRSCAPVLAHELAHAAVFSRLLELRDSVAEVEMLPSWLNEAIAHACERDMFPDSSNLARRIDCWMRDTGRWPLIPRIRRSNEVSARGPERAAGVMFVEFLQQEQSLCELVDSAALRTDNSLEGHSDAFTSRFRDWSVWMAEHYRDDICKTAGEGHQMLLLRGTAARWLRPEVSCDVTIRADIGAALQVTLLKSLPKPDDNGPSQSALSLAQTVSE